jgi:hypothetical protein
LRAEGAADLSEGRLAGFDDFAGKFIGIHHRNAAGAQELSAGRFAHADTASQPQ